jgi:hypothetical protein
MAMTNGMVWPDWLLNRADYRPSMRNLARYANPAQLRGLGLGLRSVAAELDEDANGSVGATPFQVERARELAEELAGRDVRYALEPFNPSATGGQIVRTTSELLEDRQGTCLDFAVSLAALCVQARVPVTLAVAVSEFARHGAHAFVIVQKSPSDDGHSAVPGEYAIYLEQGFEVWASAFRRKGQAIEHHLIDATPRRDRSYPGTLDERIITTLEWLERNNGTVYTVAVTDALRDLGLGGDVSPFYALPPTRRDLGLTAWLPDLPSDVQEFPRHQECRSSMPTEGSTVIVGPKGTGKSTIALLHAQENGTGRGWFLDGSDRVTLLRSLASAESQCRGVGLENDQTENLRTLAIRARERLTRTSRPWVVVVDNADLKPGEIMDLLPVPGPGQSVIVTTVEQEWTDLVGWHSVALPMLERKDLRTADQRLPLAGEELLPGLVRIARHCDQDILASSLHRKAGPKRIVAAVLETVARSAGGQGADVDAAVTAASFMPAEEVTAGWLAESQFDRETAQAVRAVQKAAGLGLLEYSRRSLGPRDDDEMPLWMHRLVREAVRELREAVDPDAGLRVLACHRRVQHPERPQRPQRYSASEIDDLSRFLFEAKPSRRSHLFAQASIAVMDILEPRGGNAVKLAGKLAEEAFPFIDMQANDYVDLACTCLMARARVVLQDNQATLEDIEKALGFCRDAVSATGDLSDYLLLRGRAEAMRGNLLRKKVDKVPRAEREEILNEAIGVLWKSFEERKLALTREDAKDNEGDPTRDTLKPDPDRHVDRAWFNLGGAYVVRADLIRHTSPDRLPETITSSLWAYAGSLSLRRARPGESIREREDTLYTAASYWGVALALYLAAVHCPGMIDMGVVAAAAELDPVRRDQTRETLLRAAEVTVARSLDIRAEIDGPTGPDTRKSRALQTKVALAWTVPGADPDRRLAGLKAGLKPFLADLDLQGVDPPPGCPAEAFTVTYVTPARET